MEHITSKLKHIWYRIKTVSSLYYQKISPVIKLPIFWVPLLLKCIAGLLLASSYATNLFIPFLTFFAKTGGMNPYTHFYETGVLNAFPYPAAMLFILSPLFFITSHILPITISFLHLLILRIPLLIADTGILLILLSWFPKKTKEVLWLYWASPILFYISYIHGQLDVVPIFLLFTSLFFLFKEKDIKALIFLGLAISAKTGIVIVFPFVVVFLLKERIRSIKIFIQAFIPIIVFFVVNYFYLGSKAFVEMVFKTKEQLKIFDLVIHYNTTYLIYIVPIVCGAVFIKYVTFKKYSRDLFMMFLGFSFFVLTLCIPPMPGWYYWIIPFATYFYIRVSNNERFVYYILSASYFIYFALVPQSDYTKVFSLVSPKIATLPNLYTYGVAHGLPMDLFVGLVFTTLQGILLYMIYDMYQRGIERYTKQKIHYKPYLIGIAGDSGSGKSTFAELLVQVFTPKNVLIVPGDDMHKWERGDEMWQRYTHLDPRANTLHADIDVMYQAKNGDSFFRKHYDHNTGSFTLPKKYLSKKVVVFEGLHSFFLNTARKVFDVKVFISPQEDLRLHWKILRDKEKRGYTKEAILEQLERREADAEKYIRVQEKHADISVSIRSHNLIKDNIGVLDTNLDLYLEITCSNHMNLEMLLNELAKYVIIDISVDDQNQKVRFSGTINKEDIENIALVIIPELYELSQEERVWRSGYNGIMQLFITYYIFESMKLERYELS